MLAKCVQRSMHLTPVYFLPLGGGCSQPGIGDRFNRDSLGYKFIEQFPAMSRGSTVESKSEFVEIGVQLLMGQCTLMGTHQPAFQHRGHPVHTGQQCRRGFAAGIDQAWPVLETFLEPGSTTCFTKATSGLGAAEWIRRRQMRPIPFPSTCTAIATKALLPMCRRLRPASMPSTYVSSTSTWPLSLFQPGRTTARCSFCSHNHAVL